MSEYTADAESTSYLVAVKEPGMENTSKDCGSSEPQALADYPAQSENIMNDHLTMRDPPVIVCSSVTDDSNSTHHVDRLSDKTGTTLGPETPDQEISRNQPMTESTQETNDREMVGSPRNIDDKLHVKPETADDAPTTHQAAEIRLPNSPSKQTAAGTCGSESDSSTDSDSSSSVPINQSDKIEPRAENSPKRDGLVHSKAGPLVPGELTIYDLPAIENLSINIGESVELMELGFIISIIDCLVVIKSSQKLPPLDEETVLFLKDRRPLGKVFETFGPVVSPFYSVRFNSVDDIQQTGVKVSDAVFYIPTGDQSFTNYVFVSQLKETKGSDASWKEDIETPATHQDFSDDEQERAMKAKSRAKNNRMTAGDTAGAEAKKKPRKRQDTRNSQPVNTSTGHSSGYGSGQLGYGGTAPYYGAAAQPFHYQTRMHPAGHMMPTARPPYNQWMGGYGAQWTQADSGYYSQPAPDSNKVKFTDSRFIQNNGC